MKQTNEVISNHRLGQPITKREEDRYRADDVAKHLAQAIWQLGREGAAVIGLEGAWGVGKSSLLNLLEQHLKTTRGKKDHIITLSPWLNGDSVSPVGSLLVTVAAIVEECKPTHQQNRKKISDTTIQIFQYIQTTSRILSPVAELAAFIPGVPNIAKYTEALSKLNLAGRKKTAAELRESIAKSIQELDLSFVVIIDDLDRLEPLQAAEVIRLVKSVADFPRFRYVLSYDRDILSSAISKALSVDDGLAYLQKVIQLPFSIPRPETFRLQEVFIEDVTSLYKDIVGDEPDVDIQKGIMEAVNLYGAFLATPRMVNLTVDALRFRFPNVRDYIWFPDLCLLQLIRITNAKLYDWAEQYLNEYSVVATRQGTVGELEKTKMEEKLRKSLESYEGTNASSVFKLGKWLPGIRGNNDDFSLFEDMNGEERENMASLKRLGSRQHWRYYFAFSAPQNVLPREYLSELLQRFSQPENYQAMAIEMLSRINEIGISALTWYEHILSELTSVRIKTLNYETCYGLLRYFFDYNDDVIIKFSAMGRWLDRHDTPGKAIVMDLLRHMLSLRRKQTLAQLNKLFRVGNAWSWKAQLMRDLLWGHGIKGGRPWPDSERFMFEDELYNLRRLHAGRMNDTKQKNQLFLYNDLGGYLYAWREIDSEITVKLWIKDVLKSDYGFLNLLNLIRGEAYSTAHGPYLSLNLEFLSDLIGPSEEIRERLKKLQDEQLLPELVDDIINSVRISERRF